MHFVILSLVVLGTLFGPQLWARFTLRRYNQPRDHYPGTGGELARHLLDRYDMKSVGVEATDRGDHYDPDAKAVRLDPEHLDGRSLTAITVAAHEVGHAIQDRAGYRPLHLRGELVRLAHRAQAAGSLVILAVPLVGVVTRSPLAAGALFLAGLAGLALNTVVHLVTLPVEWDASFRRALPILASGYLPRRELVEARRILRACALTYVAGSLASLLHLGRWLAVLRR